MKHPGYIRLGIDKIPYFEYYDLPKPDINDYDISDFLDGLGDFHIAKKEYKASKHLIKIENVYLTQYDSWVYDSEIEKIFDGEDVINNQPCEADVENNKALIIKILTL